MFDVLTVAAVADELTGTLLDGRVQKVGMVDRRTVGFEVYANRSRRYLIASADHEQPGLMLVHEAPSFDSQLVTPLLLLLRKYVRGGLIVGVEQPPLDRVVRLSIAKRLHPHNAEPEREIDSATDAPEDDEEDTDGLDDATYVHLVVEIMGRHSNVILVDDDGLIMEAVKRVTPAMSRVRPIAPRLVYTPPPQDDRGDPRRLSTAEAAVLLGSERAETMLAKVLPARLRGVSPQMAREIAHTALGSTQATVAEARSDVAAVARATRHLLEPLLTSAWLPHVYLEEGEAAAFSAVPLHHLAAELQAAPLDSISEAAERALGGGGDGAPGRHTARRERLVASIREARKRLESRLDSLEREGAKADEAERFRRWGETIYAYLWTIQPGAEAVDVEGEAIPLDKSLTAKENAQEYFERYRKAQSAGAHVPELVDTVRREMGYLDQLALMAAQAETFPELEDVRVEWDSYTVANDPRAGRSKARPRSTPPRRTRPFVDRHGNAIYLGRSGAENDRITFDIAGPNDTWLHARGVPGSHVIVRWANAAGDEDDTVLLAAASLAAYYSGGRDSGTVEVDITRRRHVRKIKGAGPGMVTYRQERTIAVRPQDERALSLDTSG